MLANWEAWVSEHMITGPMALVHTAGPDPLSDPDRSFVDKGIVARGGSGEVHCVFDPRLLRKTAIKRVDIQRNHPKEVARFVDEARITGQLEHPNVVPIHEFGAARDGSLYISMKLVEGKTLAEISDAQHTLTPAYISELITAVLRVCEALEYAHSKGVLHRDLKPENVIVGDFGQVYLLDWGVARSDPSEDTTAVPDDTSGDRVVGTPAFISPEQAIGDAMVDERTDVFGVGALLYYGLSGIPPYGDVPVPMAMFKAIAGEILPVERVSRGHLPSGLAPLITRALQRQPQKRFSSIAEFKDALEQFQRGTWANPTRSFAAGEAIITERDPAGPAYVIASGTVEAWISRGDRRVLLRQMGPGEVFGEMAHLTGGARTANVTAVTEVVVHEVSEEALNQGLGLNSWLGAFVRTLATRFRDIDAELRTLQLAKTPDSPDGLLK